MSFEANEEKIVYLRVYAFFQLYQLIQWKILLQPAKLILLALGIKLTS